MAGLSQSENTSSRARPDHRAFAFWRPFGVSFANSIAIQGVGVLAGVVLARSLGPGDRGALAAVLLWPAMYGTLGLLGIGDAVTFHVVRRPANARAVSSTALVVAAAQSAVLVALAAALTPVVLGHYGQRTVWWGLIALVQIPLTLVSQVWASVINGLQRYGWFQLGRITFIALSAAGVVALALAGELSVGSAVVTYIGANLATTLLLAGFAYRAGALGLRPQRAVVRGLLSYGLKSHVGVLSSALNQRLDQLVISVVLSSSQLGVYVVAVAVAGNVTILGNSIALQTLPQIGRSASLSETRARVRHLFFVTFVLSAAIAAVLVAIVGPLVSLFFGPAFSGAVTPARVLIVAGVFLATSSVTGNVLRSLGRPLAAGVGDLLALGITVSALIVLLPPLGLTGAALASMAAYATSALWMARRAAKELELPARGLLVVPWRIRTALEVAPLVRAFRRGDG